MNKLKPMVSSGEWTFLRKKVSSKRGVNDTRKDKDVIGFVMVIKFFTNKFFINLMLSFNTA